MHTERILRPSVSLALIALIGLLAYSNSFTGEFQLDDYEFIINNPVIGDLGSMLSPPKDVELCSKLQKHRSPRIIVMISFWLNHKLGGINPVGYHIVNFLIHLANAALVYLLVRVTISPSAKGSREQASAMDFAPLLSALLFVSHPLQTQAVTYIAQRFTSMVTLFYLGSLLAYIMARRAGPGRTGYALYGICLLSATLGMKSKEIAITLPVSVALYDYLFLAGGRKTRLMAIAPLLFIAALVPLGHFNVGMSAATAISEVMQAETPYSGTEYMLTQTRVLVTYIRLFFFPVGQSLIHDYPISKSFFEPAVLSSSAFLLTILSAGLWFAFRGGSLTARVAGFGVLWFFITLSVESSIIPLGDIMFEHRNYLPSTFVFTACSAGVLSAVGHLKKMRGAMLALLFLVPGILAIATFERNIVWQSEVSLWEDSVEKFPGIPMGHYHLSLAYARAGRAEEAQKQKNITAELDDTFKRNFYSQGFALYKAGAYDDALKLLDAALQVPPHTPTGPMGDAGIHTDLGNAYMAKGMVTNAVAHYEEALKLDPGAPSTNNNLANAYETLGNHEKAVSYYRAALSHNPNAPDVHFNLAMLYASMGRKKEARAEFEAVLRISPGDSQAREELDKLGSPSK